jgi:hypothetical protein
MKIGFAISNRNASERAPGLIRAGGFLHRSSCTVAALFLSICASGQPAHAFDKTTCAVAYENAQQLRLKLKLRRAREQLLICGHSSCPNVVTKDCNAWLEQVEAELTSVAFRVHDARGQDLTNVRVSMDGEHLRDKIDGTPSMVDPGMHVFRFEADGFAISEVRQMLRKGDRDRILDLALRPLPDETPFRTMPEPERADSGSAAVRAGVRAEDKPPPDTKAPVEAPMAASLDQRSGPPTGSYVAAGVGIVALSSFIYFGLNASSEASDLRRECKPNCPVDRVDDVRSKLVVANVSLGVGVAALGVAGVLWLVRGSSAPKSTNAVSFDLLPLGRGEGAQVVTTFNAP